MQDVVGHDGEQGVRVDELALLVHVHGPVGVAVVGHPEVCT
jgi:hypothetical protein